MNITKEYDIAIIGAGPAGATLARLIGNKYKTLLVDARNLHACNCSEHSLQAHGTAEHGTSPNNQQAGLASFAEQKCCGGLLAPDAQKWLKRFDLTLPKEIYEQYQPQKVRTLDLASGAEYSYKKQYINIDRLKFEQWLLSLVPASVDIAMQQRLRSFSHDSTGAIELKIQSQTGLKSVKTKVLIGADGAFSRVRKQLGFAIAPSNIYFAIQDSYALPNYNSEGELHPSLQEYWAAFEPSLTDFYGWVIPKNKSCLVGLALPLNKSKNKSKVTDSALDNPAKMQVFTQQLTQKGLVLGEKIQRHGALVVRPSLGDLCLGQGSVFLIGEAAGLISPSSAEGFSYAFASAHHLASSFEKNLNPTQARLRYFSKTLALRANIGFKILKSLGMYNAFLRRTALRFGFGF